MVNEQFAKNCDILWWVAVDTSSQIMSYRGSASSLSSITLSSAAALAKAPTALEQLLEEINFQRTKEMRQMLKDGKNVKR